MGRYKAEAVVIKDMKELTIVFKDVETIWAFPKEGRTNIIFHRWFESRWNYGQWGAFRESLLRMRNLNIWDCYQLAKRYHISTHGTARLPNIEGRPVKLKIERRKPWERQGASSRK